MGLFQFALEQCLVLIGMFDGMALSLYHLGLFSSLAVSYNVAFAIISILSVATLIMVFFIIRLSYILYYSVMATGGDTTAAIQE